MSNTEHICTICRMPCTEAVAKRNGDHVDRIDCISAARKRVAALTDALCALRDAADCESYVLHRYNTGEPTPLAAKVKAALGREEGA